MPDAPYRGAGRSGDRGERDGRERAGPGQAQLSVHWGGAQLWPAPSLSRHVQKDSTGQKDTLKPKQGRRKAKSLLLGSKILPLSWQSPNLTNPTGWASPGEGWGQGAGGTPGCRTQYDRRETRGIGVDGRDTRTVCPPDSTWGLLQALSPADPWAAGAQALPGKQGGRHEVGTSLLLQPAAQLPPAALPSPAARLEAEGP